MRLKLLLAGSMLTFAGRAAVAQALRLKFSRDLRQLNAGDPSALLAAYADDAVLRFNVGDHRFSGEWRGREQIGRFLQNFMTAGLRGEIKAMAMSGPPWAMTVWARFDDQAEVEGERLYANRAALVLRTRWGKVVEHEDFWVDTAPIAVLEQRLQARGIAAVHRTG